jgi:uncharacterized membrane protein YhaH (DUF805 family)
MFFQSAMYSLRKYADFSGRASRSEFWCFFFFVILAQAVARVVDALFGGFLIFGPVGGLVSLLLVVPQAAVAVRRLHDLGRSGRELLVPVVMLALLPLVMMFGGFLPRLIGFGFAGLTLLVFANLLLQFIKEGRSVPNKYGAAPTAFSFAG